MPDKSFAEPLVPSGFIKYRFMRLGYLPRCFLYRGGLHIDNKARIEGQRDNVRYFTSIWNMGPD